MEDLWGAGGYLDRHRVEPHPLIKEARDRQRRRRIVVAAVVVAASAAGAVGYRLDQRGASLASRQTLGGLTASATPTARTCVVGWNHHSPPHFRQDVSKAGALAAYVAVTNIGNEGVPLSRPLCTYSFALSRGGMMSVVGFYLGPLMTWTGKPVPTKMQLSVKANAAVGANGTLSFRP